MKPIFSLRILVRVVSLALDMSWSLMKIWPEVGEDKSPAICNKVVFPEPEGPMRAAISPFFSSRFILLRAVVFWSLLPKILLISMSFRAVFVIFLVFLLFWWAFSAFAALWRDWCGFVWLFFVEIVVEIFFGFFFVFFVFVVFVLFFFEFFVEIVVEFVFFVDFVF